jgi:MoxR-like ATPase
MATQNPLEMEGTYPLPEAQLDRFFVKLLVRYPRPEDLETILDRTTGTAQPTAAPVLCGTRIQEMSALARTIPIAKEVQRHAIALVTATHPEQQSATQTARRYIRYGASPRGLQALILGAKIRAILDGRCHVATADLHQMALPVLRHRIILNFEGQAEGVSTDDVIQRILGQLSDSSSAGIR